MPRGKNYVNNNKGVTLQANKAGNKKMEACFYGEACTRPNCIYRHDIPSATVKKSIEPCMAFLAAQCTFSAAKCRNRHPAQPEAEKLRTKFATIRCRHGTKCQTAGCLYLHPDASTDNNTVFGEPAHVAFPPLKEMAPGAATTTAAAAATPVTSAWRLAPSTAWKNRAAQSPPAAVAAAAAPPPATAAAAPAPLAPAWAQPPRPYQTYAFTAANPQQPAHHVVAVAAPAAPGSLNVNAREFVPGC